MTHIRKRIPGYETQACPRWNQGPQSEKTYVAGGVTRANLQNHLGQSTIFVLLGKFPPRRTSPHTSPQNCSCSSIANHSVARTERFQHAACLPNSLFEAKLHNAKVNINCHQLMNHLSEASLMCMSSNVISTRHVDSTIQMAPILSFQ